jgi:hypothetical protein
LAHPAHRRRIGCAHWAKALLAYALYVNDVGALNSIADVTNVFEDEAEISNVIYELN